jgi:serine protease
MRYWIYKLLFVSFLCAGVDLPAATLRVATQYTNIQAAINSAVSGDIVLVGPGIYPGNVNFNGKAITVASEHGPAQTVIRAEDQDYVVVFVSGESTNSVLRGFTIEHAPGVGGVAVGIHECSPTIEGNIFQNNTHNDIRIGSAIECDAAFRDTFPIIEGNIFRNNVVPSNSFYRVVGAISCLGRASPRIANNLFISNSCPAICFAVAEGNTALVLNNTFVGNEVGIRENVSTHLFANNVFSRNLIGCEVPTPAPRLVNNLFYGNESDLNGAGDPIGLNGNIRGNPLFSCPLAGDFRLLAGSACIDAGTHIIPQLPPYDFLGLPRIMAGVSNGPAVRGHRCA